MSTMNISLPEPLKNFVDERVASAGYGTSSEYLRELIRRDQDRLLLRNMLIEGATSPVSGEVSEVYFADLRAKTNSRVIKQQ
jgi:antitoxin ParD1/3/4